MSYSMFINVKMATIVAILTFISMINTAPENLKARKGFIFQNFILCAVKIPCSVEFNIKKFNNFGV